VDQLKYNFMLTGIMGGIDSLMYHCNNQHTQRILHLHVWYKQLYLVAAAAQDRQLHTFAVIQCENEHNECHEYFLIIL
jgi:hypothetical protein